MQPRKRGRDKLERLEEELWREQTRFDPRRMNEVIAPDFVQFGRSARIYTREDTLAAAREAINAEFPLADLKRAYWIKTSLKSYTTAPSRTTGSFNTRAEVQSGRALPTVGC